MSLIELKNVYLDYIIKSGTDSIKKTAINLCSRIFRPTHNKQIFIRNSSYRALNNISLTINKGDRIGLLGRNGAGKSTLLRVLAKIYKPNFGKIKVNGKISTLFNVTLGMDFEATGYENIINLAITKGFSKNKARELVPDIEMFTELGNFLNNPVRTYSSGMQMKLAFAVATAVAPEIMLIDEIIGAGDSHFLDKTRKRFENMVEQSHILVLTSHSEDIIKRFCNKVVILDRGEIQFIGDVKGGIEFYRKGLA